MSTSGFSPEFCADAIDATAESNTTLIEADDIVTDLMMAMCMTVCGEAVLVGVECEYYRSARGCKLASLPQIDSLKLLNGRVDTTWRGIVPVMLVGGVECPDVGW